MIAPKDSIDSQSTETPLPNGASGASDIEGKRREKRESIEFQFQKDLRRGQIAYEYSRPIPGNLARTDEIDQRPDRG